MGISLSRVAEWSEGTAESGKKLDFSPVNKHILESCVNVVETYSKKNQAISRILFNEPVHWKTQLEPKNLKGFVSTDHNIVSKQTADDGRPIAYFDLQNPDKCEIYARNFAALKLILNSAADTALVEAKLFLEENGNFLEKVFGEDLSPKKIDIDEQALFTVVEELKSSIKEDDEQNESKKMLLKLAVDIRNLDLLILHEAQGMKNKKTNLLASDVEAEYKLIKMLIQTDYPGVPFVSIRHTGAYSMKHDNGCRAPPWRQTLGEIAYYTIVPKNQGAPISTTATRSGWFINEGFDAEKGELSFEKRGDLFPNLLSLLRSVNTDFNNFMDSDEGRLLCYRVKGRRLNYQSRQISDTDDSGMGRSVDVGVITTTSSDEKSSGPFRIGASRSKSRKRTDVISQLRNSASRNLPPITPSTDRKGTKPCGDQKQSKQRLLTVKRISRDLPSRSQRGGGLNELPIDVIDTNNSLGAPGLYPNTNNGHSERQLSAFNKSQSNKTAEENSETGPTKVESADTWSSTMDNTQVMGPLDENPYGHFVDLITHERIKDQKLSPRHAADTDEESTGEPSSESDADGEEGAGSNKQEQNADLPAEYWQIGKLVKYLKGGNQTSTIISLCALRDMPLRTEVCQLAVRDVGGVDVLINLLETDEVRCKLGALKILKEISHNPALRRAISDRGGIQPMVELLRSPNRDLKCLSAEAIANVAKFPRARRTVRQNSGIKKLVALLDCPNLNSYPMTPEVERDIEVARCGALALWSCSKSARSKMAMKKAGVISLLARLLKSPHEAMLIPVVGTLEECASEQSYRVAIRTEGMIEDLVANLKSDNQELQMHCAATIFKCAADAETRDLVRYHGGLSPLVDLLSQQDNKELQAAATGAVWKCAISPENVAELQKQGIIEKLVKLLTDQPEEMKNYLYVNSVSARVKLVSRTEKVLVNVVGALGEMAADVKNVNLIKRTNGIPPLVSLLTGTNEELLVNTTRALGRIAVDPDSVPIIDRNDGIRLLWSLLKNPNPDVQANAAWALCPCIENARDSGEMVRSFVGGLEIIVSLLHSEHVNVRAAVCGAISKIAMDEENLAVITDHGVVPLISSLSHTKNDVLRRPLADAIARCCCWGTNRSEFGKSGAVKPLVGYLKSTDPEVHCSTAKALYQLSRQPENCMEMHAAGAVDYLLEMVGSKNAELQSAAAACISNIRRLALATEKVLQERRVKAQAEYMKQLTQQHQQLDAGGKQGGDEEEEEEEEEDTAGSTIQAAA